MFGSASSSLAASLPSQSAFFASIRPTFFYEAWKVKFFVTGHTDPPGRLKIVLTCPIASAGPAAPRCGVEGTFALALPSIRVGAVFGRAPYSVFAQGRLREPGGGGSISRSVEAPSLVTRSAYGTPPLRTFFSWSSCRLAPGQLLVTAPSGNAPVCK